MLVQRKITADLISEYNKGFKKEPNLSFDDIWNKKALLKLTRKNQIEHDEEKMKEQEAVLSCQDHEFKTMKIVYQQMITQLNDLREELDKKRKEISLLQAELSVLNKKHGIALLDLKKVHEQKMHDMNNSLLLSSRSQKDLMGQLKQKEEMIRRLMRQISQSNLSAEPNVVSIIQKLIDKNALI